MRVRMAACRGAYLCLLQAVFVGCWSHVYPNVDHFVAMEPFREATRVRVFADPYGSLYPSGWRGHITPAGSWERGSLLAEAKDKPALQTALEQEQARQLQAIASAAKYKQRVFVLIHSYNLTSKEVNASFHAVESRLNLRETDLVVRFYWDGLHADLAASVRIWPKAAGYSQMAGARALRSILNQIEDADVFLIAHGRGAAVALSALGNPVYEPRFLQQVRMATSHRPAVQRALLSPPSLADRGNRIRLLLVAPAVGRVDFCAASEQPTELGPFRCLALKPLGPQIKAIRYTVNERDPTLSQLGAFGDGFYAANLGLTPKVGKELAAHYGTSPEFQAFAISLESHDLQGYVDNVAFDAMLSTEGALDRWDAPYPP